MTWSCDTSSYGTTKIFAIFGLSSKCLPLIFDNSESSQLSTKWTANISIDSMFSSVWWSLLEALMILTSAMTSSPIDFHANFFSLCLINVTDLHQHVGRPVLRSSDAWQYQRPARLPTWTTFVQTFFSSFSHYIPWGSCLDDHQSSLQILSGFGRPADWEPHTSTSPLRQTYFSHFDTTLSLTIFFSFFSISTFSFILKYSIIPQLSHIWTHSFIQYLSVQSASLINFPTPLPFYPRLATSESSIDEWISRLMKRPKKVQGQSKPIILHKTRMDDATIALLLLSILISLFFSSFLFCI